jgi:pyruvate/2-oxoglutarate dehydrogenase complex dihydrolipoamide dehydrogenase (E3) component
MSSTENFDILVIGSGEAGKYLAWTMAGEGHRTAVVERELIGGLARTSRVCRARTSFTRRKSVH